MITCLIVGAVLLVIACLSEIGIVLINSNAAIFFCTAAILWGLAAFMHD